MELKLEKAIGIDSGVYVPAIIKLLGGKGVPVLLLHPLLAGIKHKGSSMRRADNLYQSICVIVQFAPHRKSGKQYMILMFRCRQALDAPSNLYNILLCSQLSDTRSCVLHGRHQFV